MKDICEPSQGPKQNRRQRYRGEGLAVSECPNREPPCAPINDPQAPPGASDEVRDRSEFAGTVSFRTELPQQRTGPVHAQHSDEEGISRADRVIIEQHDRRAGADRQGYFRSVFQEDYGFTWSSFPAAGHECRCNQRAPCTRATATAAPTLVDYEDPTSPSPVSRPASASMTWKMSAHSSRG